MMVLKSLTTVGSILRFLGQFILGLIKAPTKAWAIAAAISAVILFEYDKWRTHDSRSKEAAYAAKNLSEGPLNKDKKMSKEFTENILPEHAEDYSKGNLKPYADTIISSGGKRSTILLTDEEKKKIDNVPFLQGQRRQRYVHLHVPVLASVQRPHRAPNVGKDACRIHVCHTQDHSRHLEPQILDARYTTVRVWNGLRDRPNTFLLGVVCNREITHQRPVCTRRVIKNLPKQPIHRGVPRRTPARLEWHSVVAVVGPAPLAQEL